MVEDTHLLKHLHVKFIVVLSHFSKAQGAVLIDDASDLKDAIGLHNRCVSSELDDLDFSTYLQKY